MRARLSFAVALTVVVLVVTASVAAGTDDQIPDECRTIIGCPDAGPEPENPGDRGGYAQLLTLGVLVVGVGFVMTKVFRAARANSADRGG